MELTKEERDRRANVKMEEMKRKNEEYIKRFKEIEADKANADRMSSSVVVEPAKPYVMRARTPRAQPQSTSQAGAPPPPLLAFPLQAGPSPMPERGGPPPDPVYRFLSDPDRDGDDAGPSQQQLTPPRSSNRGGDQQDRWRGGSSGGGRGGGGNAGRGSNWTTPRGGGRGKDGSRRGGRGRGNREDRSFGGVDSSYDQRDDSSSWQFNQSVDGAVSDVGPSTPGSSGMWHNSGFNESLANMSARYGYPEPSPEASNRMGLPPSAGLSSTPNTIAFQSDVTDEGLVPEDFKLSGDLASRLNSRDIRLEPQFTDDLNNQFQTGRDGGGGGFNRSHVDWRQPQEDGMNVNYSVTIDPNGNAGAPLINPSDLRHSLTRNGSDTSWNRGGDGSGVNNSMDGGPHRQGWGHDRGSGGGHNRSWHEGRGSGRGGGGGRDSRGGRQDGRRGERGGGRRPGRGRGYDKWKAERDAIDEQRIQRARAGDGGWRRAWDNEKIKQGEREDSEPVYDPRFPPSKSEGVQLGDFLDASTSLAPSQQQQQPYPPPEPSPQTYTEDPPKSPEYTPNDPSVPPASSTDICRGGVKIGHTNRNEIRGRGRKDRRANQVRAANVLSMSALASAAGQDAPPPVAGYSGSWCVDANQEPVRDASQEPITSEVFLDPKAQLAGIDANTNESKHPDVGSLNEITKMVEQMVTQERHKQDLKKYTQQTSTVSDIGADGFGFGEDCLAAEWYDSGSRKDREARRQATEGRREGEKNKRDLWVVKDAALHSPDSSKEGSPTDAAGQESEAAPGLSFEELLQQHRSVQHEMYGTADEDDHHRQGRRSSGRASRKDGRVTKRAVRRNQLSTAETILEDPTATDSTVTDMNKVSAALEALIIETGSGAAESRPPLDGSWNGGQAGVVEAVEMRNGKKNPALETLEVDFLNKLKDVDARADSLCGVPVTTEQTSCKGAAGRSLNVVAKETETRTKNHGGSGMVHCEQLTPAVLEEGIQSDLSSSLEVFSTTEEIPPAALVPLPDDDDFSQLEGSKDVNYQDESSPKDVDNVTKPNDEGSSSSTLMAGPDVSSGSTFNDCKRMQHTTGDQETLSLASPLTSSAAREKSTASGMAVGEEAENKTTVVVTYTQLNGGATTTPVPVATLSAFNSPSTFSTTPAQGGEVVSSEALNLDEGVVSIKTPPVTVTPSAPHTDDNGASNAVLEKDTASKSPCSVPEEPIAKRKLSAAACDEQSSIEKSDGQPELGTEKEITCGNVVVLPPSNSYRTVGADTHVQTNSDLEFNETNITRVDEQVICGAAVKGESLSINSSPAVSGHATSGTTDLPGGCDTTTTAASACVGKASGSFKEGNALSQDEVVDHHGQGHLSSSCHNASDVEEQHEETRKDECQTDSSSIVEGNLSHLDTTPDKIHPEGMQLEDELQCETILCDAKNASESVVETTGCYVGRATVIDSVGTDIVSIGTADDRTVLQSVIDTSILEIISDNAGKEMSAESTDKDNAVDVAVFYTIPDNSVVETATVADSNSGRGFDDLKTASVFNLNLSADIDIPKDSDGFDVVEPDREVDLELSDSGPALECADATKVEESDAHVEEPLAAVQVTYSNDANQITSIDDIITTDSGSGTINDDYSWVAIKSTTESTAVCVEAAPDTTGAGDLDTAAESTAVCVEAAPDTTGAGDLDTAAESTAVCVEATPDTTGAGDLDTASESTAVCVEATPDTTGAGDLDTAAESTAVCVEASPDTTGAGDLDTAAESTAVCVEATPDTTGAGDLDAASESTAVCVEATPDTTGAGDLDTASESTAVCVEATPDTTGAGDLDTAAESTAVCVEAAPDTTGVGDLYTAAESTAVCVEAALDTTGAGDLDTAAESTAACVEAALGTTGAGDLDTAAESTAACVEAALDTTGAGDLDTAAESTAACVEAALDTTGAGYLDTVAESTAACVKAVLDTAAESIAACVEAALDTTGAGDLDTAAESTAACVEAALDTTSAGDLDTTAESTAARVEAALDTTGAGDLDMTAESTAACVEAALDTTGAGDLQSPLKSKPNNTHVVSAAPIEEAASVIEPTSATLLDSKAAISPIVTSATLPSSVPKTSLKSKLTTSPSVLLTPRTAAPVSSKPTKTSSSASVTGSTTSRSISVQSARSGSVTKLGATAGPAAVGSRTSSVAGKVSNKPSTVVGKLLPIGGRVSSSGVSASLHSSGVASSSKPALSSRPSAAGKSMGVASDPAAPSKVTSPLKTTKNVATSESTTKTTLSSSSSTTKVATSTPSTAKPTIKSTPSKSASATTSTNKSSASLAAKPSTAARTPAAGLSKAKSAASAGASRSAPPKARLGEGASEAATTAPKATPSSTMDRDPVAEAATTPDKKSLAGIQGGN